MGHNLFNYLSLIELGCFKSSVITDKNFCSQPIMSVVWISESPSNLEAVKNVKALPRFLPNSPQKRPHRFKSGLIYQVLQITIQLYQNG